MQQILLRENKIRRNQEHFWVVGLNNACKILFVELIALGQVNRVSTNPPELFRMAIYKLAPAVIMVHNHPSGALEPSVQDKLFTEHMYHAGDFLKITVLDHLVISETGYFSFADKGIMNGIKKSKRFKLEEQETIELETWKLEMELEQAKHRKALTIAKTMKIDGVDAESIIKYTGLTADEINKL